MDNIIHKFIVNIEKLILSGIAILTAVAAGMSIYEVFKAGSIHLADLFLLFIYVEILAMSGSFFKYSKIPVTLPILIAMTALCRLVVLHSKENDPMTLLAECGAIFILSIASFIISRGKLDKD